MFISVINTWYTYTSRKEKKHYNYSNKCASNCHKFADKYPHNVIITITN